VLALFLIYISEVSAVFVAYGVKQPCVHHTQQHLTHDRFPTSPPPNTRTEREVSNRSGGHASCASDVTATGMMEGCAHVPL